jgi:hypothetical protein
MMSSCRIFKCWQIEFPFVLRLFVISVVGLAADLNKTCSKAWDSAGDVPLREAAIQCF